MAKPYIDMLTIRSILKVWDYYTPDDSDELDIYEAR